MQIEGEGRWSAYLEKMCWEQQSQTYFEDLKILMQK